MILQKIPYFTGTQELEVRASFASRIHPNLTTEEKTSLNTEFQAAIKEAKAQVEQAALSAQAANLQAFLKNPQDVLKEIEATKGNAFDMGEMLISLGIAKVKSKRKGKGVLVGKYTDYPYTSSNFEVTTTIGPHTKTEEGNSANDRRSKDSLHSTFANSFAQEIAKEIP